MIGYITPRGVVIQSVVSGWVSQGSYRLFDVNNYNWTVNKTVLGVTGRIWRRNQLYTKWEAFCMRGDILCPKFRVWMQYLECSLTFSVTFYCAIFISGLHGWQIFVLVGSFCFIWIHNCYGPVLLPMLFTYTQHHSALSSLVLT